MTLAVRHYALKYINRRLATRVVEFRVAATSPEHAAEIGAAKLRFMGQSEKWYRRPRIYPA